MKWTPSAIYLLATAVLGIPVIMFFGMINYCRSYVSIKMLQMADYGNLHRIRSVILFIVIPTASASAIGVMLHELYPHIIIIDHIILIMEVICVNASAYCLIQSANRYFDSLCTIEQSYRMGKMIKNLLRLSGFIFTLIVCLLYLLPVILQNNNYMVFMGMILCWVVGIISIALGFAAFKLKSVVAHAVETVRVE